MVCLFSVQLEEYYQEMCGIYKENFSFLNESLDKSIICHDMKHLTVTSIMDTLAESARSVNFFFSCNFMLCLLLCYSVLQKKLHGFIRGILPHSAQAYQLTLSARRPWKESAYVFVSCEPLGSRRAETFKDFFCGLRAEKTYLSFS